MIRDYVVIDLETTGLSPEKDKIMEIGAVKIKDGKVTAIYSKLINPNVEIREKIVEITGITQDMTRNEPFIDEILQDFMRFIDGSVIIGHCIEFDFAFLMTALYNAGLEKYMKQSWKGIDTLKIARKHITDGRSRRLEDLCIMYEIEDKEHHRALNDAFVTHKLYEKLCENYESKGNEFKPEQLSYKPKRARKPSEGQIEYLKKLLAYHGLTSEYDLFEMNQSELSRYADKIVLRYGRMKQF